MTDLKSDCEMDCRPQGLIHFLTGFIKSYTSFSDIDSVRIPGKDATRFNDQGAAWSSNKYVTWFSNRYARRSFNRDAKDFGCRRCYEKDATGCRRDEMSKMKSSFFFYIGKGSKLVEHPLKNMSKILQCFKRDNSRPVHSTNLFTIYFKIFGCITSFIW